MSISRILMISTSRERSPQPAVPIGAAWVAQALHLAGFSVQLLDLCFLKDPLRGIEHALRTFRPEGIGISVRNLDNCDFLASRSFLPELKEITAFIRFRTEARLLLGGAAVSIMPREILDYLGLEHAVVGEGERAAVEFFSCRCLRDAGLVPGVVCRSAGFGGKAQPALSGAVQPQMHRWVDTRRYLGLEPVLPVQGKRGCAHRCLYCTYQRIEGDGWRVREVAAVAEEIAVAMRDTGAREFEFVDSVFNEPEGYLETLLEEILKRRLKARFRASSLSPKGLTASQVRLMERAGMTSLVITPETASDVTLAALRKGFTAEEIHRAAGILSRSSIKALWCFMIGAPQEDERTLAETIDFMNCGIGKKDSAFITTGIRVFPGTGLHELAVAEKVVDPGADLLMPTFYFSPRIAPQRARELLQTRLSDHSRHIFLSDTQLGSLGTFRRLGTLFRLPSPFWRYASFMNRITPRRRVISRNWSSIPADKK